MPTEPTEGIVFWSCDEGAEELIHSDQEDAIESYLNQRLDPGCDVLARLPKEVTAFGFVRRPLSAHDPDPQDVLEDVLYRLDEEYGDPETRTDPETPAMLEAAKAFCDVVRAEYSPWSCKKACSETINVEAWVREHRPDWLEPAHPPQKGEDHADEA